ncbi:unnamed protein product [Orchesella dallaii]|uniref:Glucose-methanol-choline oxidoreductase N-terminal domain-containing protein n=1 Tax=Orchesella dallaii TaxID=48710 RepID=A0ABP1R2T0_9HEXA
MIFSITPASTIPTASADTFDFIVVGGGTGGCAVASRLSENGQYSVLLLEAGGVPKPELDVPALVSQNLEGYIKPYQSVPQRNAGLQTNGVIPFMIGNTLGGSSSVNGMFFNRGSPYDFDNWANITNDPSWSYSSLLPYFKRAENYAGGFPSDQHGFSGPISVSRARYAPGLERWFRAGRELGYSVADPNGPQKISFTPVEFAQRRGRRVSSYTGYIKPFIASRTNLRVITNAEVSQIVFEGNRAVGVRYVLNSTRGVNSGYARAQKEVILSAGVIESPALLMKSGIGPKRVLDAAKIRQIKELPVGQKFQDQISVNLNMIINNKSEIVDLERDLTPAAWRIYNRDGDGPYTSFEGMFGQAFLRSSVRTSDKIRAWPDLHLFFANSNSNQDIGVNTRPELGEGVQLADWETSIQLTVYLGRPKSSGTITLNPQNASGPPLIDFNFLSHPEDMEVLLNGIKMMLKIYEETAAYRGIGARYPPNPLPACQHFKFRSDEYWRCYIRQRTVAGIHAGGSCRMGSGPQDKDAVVDSNLRVMGIEGLRIVDGSVMPIVTNTNNHAAVYAIAEKASDMILTREHQLQQFVSGLTGSVLCQKPWESSPKDKKWWAKRHQEILNTTSTLGKEIKILFIGSSSVDYWRSTAKDLWDSKYVPLGAVNYGIRGDRTENVLWRIENGELDGLSPKLVVIYIGSNNVPRNTQQETVKGVDTVIEKLHEKLPNANLLFVSFFPRADRNPVPDTLKKIRNITDTLEPLINGDTRRKSNFLDIFWSLAPESLDGIYEEYYRDDKLHMNKDGYAVWDKLMNQTFYSLIN